ASSYFPIFRRAHKRQMFVACLFVQSLGRSRNVRILDSDEISGDERYRMRPRTTARPGRTRSRLTPCRDRAGLEPSALMGPKSSSVAMLRKSRAAYTTI